MFGCSGHDLIGHFIQKGQFKLFQFVTTAPFNLGKLTSWPKKLHSLVRALIIDDIMAVSLGITKGQIGGSWREIIIKCVTYKFS